MRDGHCKTDRRYRYKSGSYVSITGRKQDCPNELSNFRVTTDIFWRMEPTRRWELERKERTHTAFNFCTSTSKHSNKGLQLPISTTKISILSPFASILLFLLLVECGEHANKWIIVSIALHRSLNLELLTKGLKEWSKIWSILSHNCFARFNPTFVTSTKISSKLLDGPYMTNKKLYQTACRLINSLDEENETMALGTHELYHAASCRVGKNKDEMIHIEILENDVPLEEPCGSPVRHYITGSYVERLMKDSLKEAVQGETRQFNTATLPKKNCEHIYDRLWWIERRYQYIKQNYGGKTFDWLHQKRLSRYPLGA